MVSREDFFKAVDKAQDILSDIRAEDLKSGTVTGLSHVRLFVDECPEGELAEMVRDRGYDPDESIVIHTYNAAFEGNGRRLHHLGTLDDGTEVFWLEDDLNIVSGAMGMDPILELFDKEE